MPSSPTITRRLAAFPAAGGLVARLAAGLLCWQGRSRSRHALARLTDEQLRDVGLTRADILREASKPFWRA